MYIQRCKGLLEMYRRSLGFFHLFFKACATCNGGSRLGMSSLCMFSTIQWLASHSSIHAHQSSPWILGKRERESACSLWIYGRQSLGRQQRTYNNASLNIWSILNCVYEEYSLWIYQPQSSLHCHLLLEWQEIWRGWSKTFTFTLSPSP